MPRSGLPRLHIVTDSSVLARPDFVERAASVMDAGAGRIALHIRGPRSTGRRVYELAVALAREASGSGTWLLVNDRVDVALAAGLDGAHLGARSLSVSQARALLGPERMIGASVHDVAALRTARDDGANYAFVGTVYDTESHPGRATLGSAGLGGVIDEVLGIPVLAIGGIDPDRVREVTSAGAFGVAVLRGVWAAPDPAAAVLGYLAALESPSTEGI
ncbi:MAG: thiamine phosphate synthase [Gemmatimonadota bacterium]